MPSLISGYEYDIFISYRQKDNKYWKRLLRTSSMKYKGVKKSVSEIAKELGVTNILEGSNEGSCQLDINYLRRLRV